MFEVALFVALMYLSASGFIALRRESSIRREFGQSGVLDVLALALPLAPLAMFFGQRYAHALVVFGLAGALFLTTLLVASRQRKVLECSGTDRTNDAIAATSKITLASIVGVIYLALASLFWLIVNVLDLRHGSV